MTAPLLTVGVITFDTADALVDGCLASIAGSAAEVPGAVEVLLLDNGSTRPPAVVRAPAGRARVLREPRNLGFGAAANVLAREARGEHLLLLNPDARLRPGALAALLAAAAEHPGPALLTGWLVADGRVQVDAYRTWRTSTGRRRSTGAWRARLAAAEHGPVLAVDKVCGGALLGRTELLRALGPFDEAFFLYGEDADLSLRAAADGVATLLVPAAVVDHAAASSMGAHAALVERARVDAALRLNARHAPRWLGSLARVELLAVTLAGAVAGGRSSAGRRTRLARLRELARWRWHREAARFAPG